MATKAQDNYFVRCKAHPEHALRHFFLSHSIIHHKCTCGVSTSYSRGNKHLPYYQDHLDVFKIFLKPTKEIKEWEAYYDKALELVSADPEAYRITWDDTKPK